MTPTLKRKLVRIVASGIVAVIGLVSALIQYNGSTPNPGITVSHTINAGNGSIVAGAGSVVAGAGSVVTISPQTATPYPFGQFFDVPTPVPEQPTAMATPRQSTTPTSNRKQLVDAVDPKHPIIPTDNHKQLLATATPKLAVVNATKHKQPVVAALSPNPQPRRKFLKRHRAKSASKEEDCSCDAEPEAVECCLAMGTATVDECCSAIVESSATAEASVE